MNKTKFKSEKFFEYNIYNDSLENIFSSPAAKIINTINTYKYMEYD